MGSGAGERHLSSAAARAPRPVRPTAARAVVSDPGIAAPSDRFRAAPLHAGRAAPRRAAPRRASACDGAAIEAAGLEEEGRFELHR